MIKEEAQKKQLRCLILLGLHAVQVRVIDPKDKTTFEGATPPLLKFYGRIRAAVAIVPPRILLIQIIAALEKKVFCGQGEVSPWPSKREF